MRETGPKIETNSQTNNTKSMTSSPQRQPVTVWLFQTALHLLGEQQQAPLSSAQQCGSLVVMRRKKQYCSPIRVTFGGGRGEPLRHPLPHEADSSHMYRARLIDKLDLLVSAK